MKKDRHSGLGNNILFALIFFLVSLPLIICLVNSFRSTADLLHGFIRLPEKVTFDNYEYVIYKRDIFRYVANSLLITTIGVSMSLVINPFIAYCIAMNWEKKSYRILYIVLSSLMFIPVKTVLFPLIKIYYYLGLMNIGGLLLYYAVFVIPETVFMLVPYFRFFKGELREAAIMDGCSMLRFYRMVFFPVCRPFIITVMILNAVWIWNDFFIPLMILNKTPSMWTLPIFIYNYLGKNSFHQGYSFAACQIALLPVILFYAIFHKRIINGLNLKRQQT